MKHILAQLHKIASYLEDNNYLEDSKEINKVFVKLSDRKKVIWQPRKDNPYQSETGHIYSRLKDNKKVPLPDNDITAGDILLDLRIRNAPAYSYYQDLYMDARDAYQTQLNKFSNRQFQSNKKETEKLEYLRADWEAKVDDFENWFFKALIQAKVNGRIPGIPKPVTKQVQTKPTVTKKPVVEEKTPVSKPAKPPVAKPEVKPNPVQAPVTTNTPATKPPMEIGEPEITNRATHYMEELKQRMKSENLKSWQAFALMQFRVYNEDKTSDKRVYKKWQQMIDDYDKQVQNNDQKQSQ